MAPAIPLIVVNSRTSVAFLSIVHTVSIFHRTVRAMKRTYPMYNCRWSKKDKSQKVTGWRRTVLPQRLRTRR